MRLKWPQSLVGVWQNQQKAACLHRLHQQLSKWDWTAEHRQEEGNGSEYDSGEFSCCWILQPVPLHCRHPENKRSSSFQGIHLASLCWEQWRRKARMSLQELPGSFGVLFSAFSRPMKAERSRNKERLEASLAGLCELELLKQRQECRVLSALCLGDSLVPGRPPWGALRSAHYVQDASNGNASDDYSLRHQTVSSVFPMRVLLYWSIIIDVLLVCRCKGQFMVQHYMQHFTKCKVD